MIRRRRPARRLKEQYAIRLSRPTGDVEFLRHDNGCVLSMNRQEAHLALAMALSKVSDDVTVAVVSDKDFLGKPTMLLEAE